MHLSCPTCGQHLEIDEEDVAYFQEQGLCCPSCRGRFALSETSLHGHALTGVAWGERAAERMASAVRMGVEKCRLLWQGRHYYLPFRHDSHGSLTRPRLSRREAMWLLRNNSSTAEDLARSRGVDLRSHVSFARSVVLRQRDEFGDLNKLRRTIDDIEARLVDPRVFVAMVGEFSSGKSMLINGLLRESILTTDILPATTAAATLIHYGDEPIARVFLNSPPPVAFCRNVAHAALEVRARLLNDQTPYGRRRVHQLISRCTSVEKQSRKVRQVNIRYPSQLFASGIVLVDTPGINVENDRHVSLTERVIVDLCDGAIVVIPAIAPLSEHLRDFLAQHLGQNLRKCVFALTKMDLLRPREHKRMIEFVQSVLQREFGVSDPCVLPFGHCHLIGDAQSQGNGGGRLEPETPGELPSGAMEAFVESEKLLLRELQEHRLTVVTAKLGECLEKCLGELSCKLTESTAKYAAEYNALVRNALPDLRAFTQDKAKKHSDAIRRQAVEPRNALRASIARDREKALALIRAGIMQSTSKLKLRRYLRRDGSDVLEQLRSSIVSSHMESIRAVTSLFDTHRAEFHHQFALSFRNLAALDGSFTPALTAANAGLSMLEKDLNAKTSALATSVSRDLVTQGAKGLGTAGAGAALGTLLLPGIGTVVGGIAGGWLASRTNKSFELLRSELVEAMEAKLTAWFDSCEGVCLRNIDSAATWACNSMSQLIGQYESHYERVIRGMVKEDERKKTHATARRASIEEDLADIGLRLRELGGDPEGTRT